MADSLSRALRWRRFGLLALFMLATSQLLAAALQDDLQRGLEQLRRQEFNEALLSFEAYRRQHPGDARPFYYSGLALVSSNRLREGAAALQQAVRLDGSAAHYHLAYARVLFQLGHQSAASQALAPLESPAFTSDLDGGQKWQLADLYYRLDRPQAVLDLLDRLEPSHREVTEVQLRRGEVLLRLGRAEEASKVFTQVLSRQPDQHEARYGLGMSYWKMEQREPALQELQLAAVADPANPDYQYQYALLLMEVERPADAVAALLKVEGSGPSFPEIYSALARAYRRSGDGEKALEYAGLFSRLRERQQQQESAARQSEALAAQATEQLQNSQVDRAHDLFVQAVKTDPDNWKAHSFLAKIYLSSGKTTQADAHLEAMERLIPGDYEVHFLRADYYYRIGRVEEALKRALQARAVQPGEGSLRNLLGNIYMRLGRREEALAEYQAAVELEPGREAFRLNLESVRRKEPRW